MPPRVHDRPSQISEQSGRSLGAPAASEAPWRFGGSRRGPTVLRRDGRSDQAAPSGSALDRDAEPRSARAAREAREGLPGRLGFRPRARTSERRAGRSKAGSSPGGAGVPPALGTFDQRCARRHRYIARLHSDCSISGRNSSASPIAKPPKSIVLFTTRRSDSPRGLSSQIARCLDVRPLAKQEYAASRNVCDLLRWRFAAAMTPMGLSAVGKFAVGLQIKLVQCVR